MGKGITNSQFQECLNNNKIKKFPQAKGLIDKELKTAKEDLKVAQESLANGHHKWATIQGYYAMFHAARDKE